MCREVPFEEVGPEMRAGAQMDLEKSLKEFDVGLTLVGEGEIGLARDAYRSRWFHRFSAAEELLTFEIAASFCADATDLVGERMEGLDLFDSQKRAVRTWAAEYQ